MSLAPAPTTTLLPQGRVALLAVGAGAAEGHALGEAAVVADHRGLADDDAHAVVDEQPLADAGAGVDLDAGEEAAEEGDQLGQDRDMRRLCSVWARRWSLAGVKARVGEDDLERVAAAGSRSSAALISLRMLAMTDIGVLPVHDAPPWGFAAIDRGLVFGVLRRLRGRAPYRQMQLRRKYKVFTAITVVNIAEWERNREYGSRNQANPRAWIGCSAVPSSEFPRPAGRGLG